MKSYPVHANVAWWVRKGGEIDNYVMQFDGFAPTECDSHYLSLDEVCLTFEHPLPPYLGRRILQALSIALSQKQ